MRPPARTWTVVATKTAHARAMTAAAAMTRAPIRYPVGTVRTLGRPAHTIRSWKSESLATLGPLPTESALGSPAVAVHDAHRFKGRVWGHSDHLDVMFPKRLRRSGIFVACMQRAVLEVHVFAKDDHSSSSRPSSGGTTPSQKVKREDVTIGYCYYNRIGRSPSPGAVNDVRACW